MKNNGKNNVQVTGVATATNGNGNGNGNGKKTEMVKPENNVKVVSPDDFDRKEAIKITPFIDCLTKKGVEMYTDMGDLANAKLFVDELFLEGGDQTTLVGIMMLLDAIVRKIKEEDKRDHPEDFIGYLQDYLFYWTIDCDRTVKAYIDAVRSGNFVVGEIPEGDFEEFNVNIKPPKHKFKAQETGLRAEINSLAETVRALQDQINGKTKEPKSVYADSPKIPTDFEGLYPEEVLECDFLRLNCTLFLDVQQFPGEPHPRVINSFYKKRTDGNFALEINHLPASTEEYPYSPEDGEKKLKSETQSYDPNNGEGDTLDELRGGMLALALSELLANPNLPREIYEGIADGINELSNTRGNRQIFDSAEYIEKVLEFHESTEEREAETSKKVVEEPVDENTDILAVKISEILNDSNTPPEIYEGLMEGLTTTYNQDVDQTEFTEYEKSPAYIARLIRGYQKKQERVAA